MIKKCKVKVAGHGENIGNAYFTSLLARWRPGYWLWEGQEHEKESVLLFELLPKFERLWASWICHHSKLPFVSVV
jgi:hypothetical protein